MKMGMSRALMKMEVLGIEKVGKTWAKMDTDVDGQGWVVNHMMFPQNGKKRYINHSIPWFFDVWVLLTWSEAKWEQLSEVFCVIGNANPLFKPFFFFFFQISIFLSLKMQLNNFDLLMIFQALAIDILRHKWLKLAHKLLSFEIRIEFCCWLSTKSRKVNKKLPITMREHGRLLKWRSR